VTNGKKRTWTKSSYERDVRTSFDVARQDCTISSSWSEFICDPTIRRITRAEINGMTLNTEFATYLDTVHHGRLIRRSEHHIFGKRLTWNEEHKSKSNVNECDIHNIRWLPDLRLCLHCIFWSLDALQWNTDRERTKSANVISSANCPFLLAAKNEEYDSSWLLWSSRMTWRILGDSGFIASSGMDMSSSMDSVPLASLSSRWNLWYKRRISFGETKFNSNQPTALKHVTFVRFYLLILFIHLLDRN
jgi:hypothetical protein